MLSPDDLVRLGSSVAEELSRIAGSFHEKDQQHDDWAEAADRTRGKMDELRSLLKLPGLAEELSAAPALRQAQSLQDAASLEQKSARFEQVFQALAPQFADALKAAWLGEWEINDDGLLATLRITRFQTENAEPGRDLKVEYIGHDGVTGSGYVKKSDPPWHHLHFFVNFGASSRYFDAYLFKWDKRRLAGTSEGRGFYAVKSQGPSPDQL